MRPIIEDSKKRKMRRALFRAFIFIVVSVIPCLFISLHLSFFLVAGFFDDTVNVSVSDRVLVFTGCALGLFLAAMFSLKAMPAMGSSLFRGVQNLVGRKPWGEESAGMETPRPARRSLAYISEDRTKYITSRLSFLGSYSEGLHCVVVIGSAAYGIETDDSDIDIVIICRKEGYDAIRDLVCEKEISEAEPPVHQKIEYTVLSAAETEDLFRQASPFAHSILRGVVIFDDGYWKQLKNRGCGRLPARSYVMRSIRETVMVQYFGSIHTLQRDIRRNSCCDSCCSKNTECRGISSDNVLARVIMRMLYITLPSRGYMPVTKSDVIHFGGEVYGEESRSTVEKVVSMLRQDKQPLLYRDYVIMRKFATKLFRETLLVAGLGADVTVALKNVTNLMRGHYGSIDDCALRACVIKDSTK